MKNIEVDSSCSTDEIKHDGVVTSVEEKKILVSIVTQSACASCNVKGACNVTDLNNEIVEVANPQNPKYNIGDKVHVTMEKSMGTKAVMLGYIIPILLVFFTLILMMSISTDEGIAGLVSLGILVPYYSTLYFYRKVLKKTFVFRIS